MVMTVVVMSGAVVAPTNAAAQAGDLIKMDGLSAVYYLGDDGQRYVFPNETTYMSWYSDFSGVVTVPSSELQSYPIGGNVTMRPGTNLVKITTDPTVYAVEPGGELRSIVSEENAIDLYGADWADRVVDVPDAFFVNYEQGSALTEGEYPTGTLVQEEGGSDVYYVDANGDYRMFSGEAAFLANNYKWSDVVTTSETLTASGSEITGFESELFNPAGGATSGGGDVPTGTGLSAALSSSTPAATTIPYDVQGQVYTSVNLTASNDGAVELTGLEVKRTGLGYYDSFDKVYVEVDGVRHGNKRSLGSDNIANLYFNTESSKITIPAGETITLDIVADMKDRSEGNAGDNALGIVSASAVDTSATVSGSFPITGNMMSVSSVGAPAAEFTLTDQSGDVYLGDEQVEVAEFDLENKSTSEDISFSEITLENKGTADASEVINYTLYNDSDEVISGPVDADSNDMIYFMLDESVEIEDGDKETYTVKADIYDGRNTYVGLKLDETTDVKAVGLNNGYNVVVNDASGTLGTVDGSDYGYKINGGDLSFSEADSNPGSVDVAPADEDVLFLAADVEALEEMMTVTSIDFTLSGTVSSLEDVTVYLDGQVVAGPIDGAATLEFDDEFQVNGTQLLEVKADIADEATAGDYYINLDSASSDVTAENEEGDSVDSGNIKGSVDGGTISIATGEVTLSEDSTYGDRSVVSGSDDLLVGQYVLEVGDAEGVKIDKYTVDLDLTTLTTDNIDELYISEDNDIITDVATTGNDFNVNQELSAGETKVIKVYASVDDDFSTGSLYTKLTVEGEGLISSENLSEGPITGQTMTFATGSLTETVSAGTPDSDIVVAGTNDVKVAEWEFESENTSYKLRDIKVQVHKDTVVKTLTVSGTATSSDPASADVILPSTSGTSTVSVDLTGSETATEIAAALQSAIDGDGNWSATSDGGVVTMTAESNGAWALRDVDASALITAASDGNETPITITEAVVLEKALITSATLNGETANVINGVATFDEEISVDKDDKQKLELYANFNGDFNSIESGDMANFAITSYEKKAGNENTYSNVDLGTSSLFTNEVMYTRNTVPTIVASAGATANLKTTDNKVMDLDITADAAGDVTIKENKINIITNVATTGNDVTVVVKNSNGNTVGTVSAVSGTGLSVSDGVVTASGATFNGTYTIDWTNKNAAGEVIGAGNTKVYTVQVSFGNSVGTDKSLTVELEEYLAWRDDEVTSDITGQADLIDDLSGSFEIDNK
jgi:hypothetical protein